jgi:cytochrome c peroxidase
VGLGNIGRMKEYERLGGRFLGLAMVGLAVSAYGSPETINGRLTLNSHPELGQVQLTITDAGNHEWRVQRATNFGGWEEMGVQRVYNGSFHSTFKADASGLPVFFRGYIDSAQSEIPATVENALHLPGIAFNYAAPQLPPNFLVPPISTQDNTPATNPITDAGALLGRVLFYDKRLSTNGTVACASCHQQGHGFADARRFSLGFNGGSTSRNSMGLTQARYYPRGHFFWDERAATLEEQVLQPIQNATEMGMSLVALEERLGSEPFYTNLFLQAYGPGGVTAERISGALAQFVRSIVSTRSKYDRGIPAGFTNFSAQENLGRRIFFGQVGNATCAACHGTDNFVPNAILNNGLENPYLDKGVGALTGRGQDEGLFKVPSLRNIELTAPYMHDGRFASLEAVVEFYNSGVTNHPNLSPPLRVPTPPGTPPGPPRRLNLTLEEKAALVAFLKTLTDTGISTDPKWSDPFNYGN